jgi:hypothetical protein
LDFSALKISPSNDPQVVAKSFDDKFNAAILRQVAACAKEYNLDYTPPHIGDASAAVIDLQLAVRSLQLSIPKEADRPLGIYVFVDEFDAPFTRTVIGSTLPAETKTEVLRLITQTYSAFFESVKQLPTSRFLMTGIVDMLVPTLSGGSFNHATFDPYLHTFAGFTEEEVKRLLAELKQKTTDDTVNGLLDGALEPLRDAYNGYWFADVDMKQPKIYNADMVLYFLNHLLTNREYPSPNERIDSNATISDNILNFAASLPTLAGLLKFPPEGDLEIEVKGTPASMIMIDEVMKVFKAENLPQEKARIENMFLSLCYYFGALTTKAITPRTGPEAETSIKLGVPNGVARLQYLKSINAVLSPGTFSLAKAKENVRVFISDNNPQPMLASFLAKEFLINQAKEGGSDAKSPEGAFKSSLAHCLNLVRGDLFTVETETEVKVRRLRAFSPAYIDVLLLPSDLNKKGIAFELKELNAFAVLKVTDGDYNDFNQAIADCAALLKDKSDEEILNLEVLAYLNKTKQLAPIRDHLTAAETQLRKYLELLRAQKPRSAGYRGWVFIRVGTTRVIAREVL